MIAIAGPSQLHFTGAVAPASVDLPSPENFLSLVQHCRETKEVTYSQRVHLQICAYGLETLQPLGNYLVPMFVDCGSLPAAQQVFHRLGHQNEHSWTSIIQGHVESGNTELALDMLEPMQVHAISPTTHTCVALLKACSHLKSLERGLEVHHFTLTYGLESHSFVGNTLVDMFANCGAFSEARHVFDRLMDRSIVSWTSLLALHAEEGDSDGVVQCLDRMVLDGVSPNCHTFVCCLNACEMADDFGIPQELHLEIVKHGFDQNVFIGNALIHVYCKLGLISEAEGVFNNLEQKDVITWTTLIIGQSQHGYAEDALLSLEEMLLEGVCPNAVTFIGGFRACGTLQSGDKGLELHSTIIELALDVELPMINAMIDMYAICSLFEEAQTIFNTMTIRNVDTWNIMIGHFADLGLGEESQLYFLLMQLDGLVSPDDSTFTLALKACGLMRSIERGYEVHSQVVKVGSDADAFTSGALVDMYAKCRMLVEAQYTFDHSSNCTSVAWTSLIMGYAEHGLGEDALGSLDRLRMDGFCLDSTALASGLKACTVGGDIDDLLDLHSEIYLLGLEEEDLIVGSLINAYCNWGMVLEARIVFEKSATQDIASWNSLIAGYTKEGLADEALDLAEKMQHLADVIPDAITYICCFNACSIASDTSRAKLMHAEIVKRGYEGGPSIGKSLVNMYLKCAALAEAKSLVADVVSWTSLMSAYWESGLGGEAVQCLKEMQEDGVSPDVLTFVCSLKACVNSQALREGQQLHAEVVKEGFEYDAEIVSYLAELYSQCDLALDAEDVTCLNASNQ